MQRPSTIACQRCGDTVTVRGMGPVPAYCSKCRSRSKDMGEARPVFIECRLCGSPVAVKSRGPLPQQCRGGCKKPTRVVLAKTDHASHSEDVAKPGSEPRARPVDKQRRSPSRRNLRSEPQLTRLDVAAEAQRLATANYGFHVRLSQFRQGLFIAMWLLLILTVVFIFVLGSRPPAQDLDGFTS